jgi:Uma2 family endonuclease
MATVVKAMTTEELLALPNDGVERWLIDGELRERPSEGELRGHRMTLRNRFHSRVMTLISTELELWRREQPAPRGQVLSGEAGVRLRRDPDTTVGIDVVYVPPEVMVKQTEETALIDGVPTLVAEILSPNDTVEEVHEKIAKYRQAGVPVVWIIDPYDQTVTVHRAGGKPVLFNADQELSGEPQLPGFRVPVARLFE